MSTIFTATHFPAEILPNTVFPSKSMQPDKNIHMLLKVFVSCRQKITRISCTTKGYQYDNVVCFITGEY